MNIYLNKLLSFCDIQNRLIAVDTEYQTTENAPAESRIERETTIHRVWCAAFTHNGERYTVWTGDMDTCQGILDNAARYFGIENPVFVSYYYNAEYEAFLRLGVDISLYDWIDVYLLYRLKMNVFSEHAEMTLGSMCKDVLKIDIDTVNKDDMRQLCITGDVSGNEQTIMDYCADDTAHLVPAIFALEDWLTKRLANPVTMPINCQCRGDRSASIPSLIFDLMESLKAFTRISHRGIPVNGDRLKAVRDGARVIRDRLIKAFVEKYPGTWEFVSPSTKSLDKVVSEEERLRAIGIKPIDEVLEDFQAGLEGKSVHTVAMLNGQYVNWYEKTIKGVGGDWKRNDKECRRYLLSDLQERGLLNTYPRTASGKLSLSQDDLKDVFGKQEGTFGGDFRRLTSRLTCYNGLLADGKKDWLSAYDAEDGLMRYRTLNPFHTVTGRCAPSPSNGWILGWDKSLYCVIEPPEGRWLVELDFGSEETFIQAQVFDDPAYRELYASKDIYLYTGVLTGMIPREDFEALPKSELKVKYKKERDLLKTFTLAIGYGAGNAKLSGKTGLQLSQVSAFRDRYNQAFARTTFVRSALKAQMESGTTRCLWLANGWNAVVKRHLLQSYNSPLNFPIQGMGSVILHNLVRELEKAGIRTIATVHDAIVIDVAENDWATIERARGLMKYAADYVLNVQDGEEGMKVGEPEIVKYGEIWTPEHAYDNEAREILTAGGYFNEDE